MKVGNSSYYNMSDYPYTNKEVFGTYFKVVGVVIGIIIVLAVGAIAYNYLSSEPEEQREIIEDVQIKTEQFANNNLFSDSTQRTITYSVENLPSIPDTSIPKNALVLALSKWENNNENLKFVEVNQDGDIDIVWKKFASPHHTGLASCFEGGRDTVYGCELEISLGDSDCRGNYVQADVGMVANTIMHEIGHSFGLDHHPNENHLMFGYDADTTFSFDDRGFTIPLEEDEYYVGEKTLWDSYDKWNYRITDLQPQIDRLESKYESLSSQYSVYEGRTLPQHEYQKANSLYNELESIRLELNHIIEQSNQFVELSNQELYLLDCYPNIDIED